MSGGLAFLTEAQVEQLMMDRLAALGWSTAYGPDDCAG